MLDCLLSAQTRAREQVLLLSLVIFWSSLGFLRFSTARGNLNSAVGYWARKKKRTAAKRLKRGLLERVAAERSKSVVEASKSPIQLILKFSESYFFPSFPYTLSFANQNHWRRNSDSFHFVMRLDLGITCLRFSILSYFVYAYKIQPEPHTHITRKLVFNKLHICVSTKSGVWIWYFIKKSNVICFTMKSTTWASLSFWIRINLFSIPYLLFILFGSSTLTIWWTLDHLRMERINGARIQQDHRFSSKIKANIKRQL